MGLYVQLDTNWPDNPKVIAAGLEGAGLHAMALCLAKRLETDGVLSRAQLRRLGGRTDLIDKLIELGLLDRIDGDRVVVHDWLDRNSGRRAIGATREASRREGKRGNHKRWGHPGDFATCPRCNPRSSPDPIGPDRPTTRPPIGSDRSRDRDRVDTATAGIWAAFEERAKATAENIEAMLAAPPSVESNLDGIAAAREATRRGPRETEST